MRFFRESILLSSRGRQESRLGHGTDAQPAPGGSTFTAEAGSVDARQGGEPWSSSTRRLALQNGPRLRLVLSGYEERGVAMTVGFHEIQMDESPEGKIVTLRIKEKLRKKDYDEFVPMLEGLMGKGATVRILVELHDFKGWTAGALWEDTKFAARHFSDIDRLAVVGETKWEKGVTVFIKPFTKAQVRYFDMKEIDSARQWVRSP